MVLIFVLVIIQVLLTNTDNNTNSNMDISTESVTHNQEIQKDKIWEITIEKIGLHAQIRDGVDSQNLDEYVGHFKQSGYLFGNVALAAHNRGYPVNYFKDIKNLEIGDKIYYRFGWLNLKYIVYSNRIIKDTDVDIVENTKENIITLITCVENKPNERRCVQGKLKF